MQQPTGIAGAVSEESRRSATLTGSVVAGIFGAAGVVLGLVAGLGASGEAMTAFGVVLALASAVPVVTTVVTVRSLPAPAVRVPVA